MINQFSLIFNFLVATTLVTRRTNFQLDSTIIRLLFNETSYALAGRPMVLIGTTEHQQQQQKQKLTELLTDTTISQPPLKSEEAKTPELLLATTTTTTSGVIGETSFETNSNYTVQMSDPIPSPAHSELSSGAETTSGDDANETTMDTTAAGIEQSVIYTSPHEYLPHVRPYHRWVCDMYFNYTALFERPVSRPGAIVVVNRDIAGASETSVQEGREEERHVVVMDTSANNPSVSSHSLPLLRQEAPSPSASPAGTSPDESLDLTAINTAHHRRSMMRSGDSWGDGEGGVAGHRNRFASGPDDDDVKEDVERIRHLNRSGLPDGVGRAHQTSADESLGGSSSVDHHRNTDNDIPGVPTEAATKSKSEHRTSSDEVAADPVDGQTNAGEDSQSYWSKTSDLLVAYLLSGDKESNKREPPIGIERFYYYLFGPPTTVDAKDYIVGGGGDDGNVGANAAEDELKEPDFEQAFGVSGAHMQWLCSKLRVLNVPLQQPPSMTPLPPPNNESDGTEGKGNRIGGELST